MLVQLQNGLKLCCDKRLSRLISIHSSNKVNFRHCCHVANHSTTMRIGTVSRFRLCKKILKHSKSTSGGIPVQFRKSQVRANKLDVQVRHQSHTAEQKLNFFSLDASLRMDGTPALDFRDSVIEVFHSSPNQTTNSKSQGNLSRNTTLHMKSPNPTKHADLDLNNVDYVSSNVRPYRFGAMLHVF